MPTVAKKITSNRSRVVRSKSIWKVENKVDQRNDDDRIKPPVTGWEC